MRRGTGGPSISALVLLTALSTVLGVNRAHDAAAATSPLSSGSTTMVSTLANGTSVPTNPALAGANEIAISDDGKVIAFTSAVPAEELVTDPTQTGHVTDNNTGFSSGGIGAGLDVFVYDSRLPGPLGPIISLVSWNSSKTGTGNAPSDTPVMAPLGVGLVFRSSATDLVTGAVGFSQQHLYAWVPGLSQLTSVFLIDNKFGTHDACDCASQNPSITLFPPTVVFHSTGVDLVPQGFPLHGDQVFATNILLGTTSVVSLDVNGEGVVGGADEPMIAADAPIVVFRSTGNDLTAGFVSVGSNIWVRNLLTSTTTLVSTSATGNPGGTSGNHNPVISRLGNAVAWSSNDPDVTTTPFFNPGQTTDHIFYRSVLPMGSTQMVDTGATGLLGCDDHSNNAGISGDGLAVVFESNCTDIVASPLVDTNGSSDVFIRHMLFDAAPQLVSINDAHTGTGQSGSMLCGPGGGSFDTACASLTNPSVTVNFDGTALAFFTNANDVATVPNPPVAQGGTSFHQMNGNVVVGYPSLLSTKTVNASVSITNENPQGTSGTPVISADGGSVAFVSFADDLVNGDANGTGDVFVKDIHNSFVIQPIVPVHEGDGHVTIALHRSGTNGTTDTVSYATGDGSTPDLPVLPPEITNPGNSNATQPGDYTETSGKLVFPPGIDTLTFDVPITDDNVPEDPELFHVSISAAGGAAGVALPGPLSAAYVVILDDDAPPQDWHVSISTPPPATAQVGDTVSVGYTVSVDAGASSLTVSSVSSGAGTSGLDSASFPTPPATIAAGTTSAESTATARVVAVPGSPGVHLQLSVDGTLGAVAGTRTAESSTIAVGEAVTATLAQTLATPGLADQVTYTLTVTNGSDTDAQLTGLPAGFAAPAGTTEASRTDGPTTVAANADSVWTLTVDIADSDADAATITQAPSGLMYAMSAAGLAARPVSVTPSSVTATVSAPVVVLSAHTLTDVNGGTLDPGDLVDVSITASNTGGGAVTLATLSDALTELTSPTNVQVDGAPCGACSTTASSVTAPLGATAAGGVHVVTFTATVPASPGGPTASSSATVAFDPATAGTSPTAPSIASLSIGATNLQDWHVAVTQQPPSSAEVGDTVTIEATISVDAGADALSVTALAAGAATAGLDTIAFADATPFTVNAGASRVITVTARLTGTPGSSANLLDVAVTGALGAAPAATKGAATNALTSAEAVSATLAEDTAAPGLGGQITYTVTFTNHSDSAATLSGVTLPTPAGTTNPVAVNGPLTLAAGGSSTFTLAVDVAAADVDGLAITETPAALYAMASPPVAARAVTFTPATVTATVRAPVVSVSTHALVDVDGGTLDPGDAVNVSITVANSGGAAATAATLSEALIELVSPANVQLDGVACGACSTTVSSVTAPLGAIAAGGAHVVTFTATIPLAPGGPTTSSSATVTFSPATTGTSPTTANVRSLTIGAAVPPVAANDSYATDEDVPLSVAAPGVLGNDSGSSQLHAVVASTASAHGTVALAPDGSFTYTPDANFNGSASFTYVANDGTSDSNVATVTITVHAVNDAPAIGDGNVTVTAGGAVDIDLNAFATDVDGDPLTFTIVTPPAHGTLPCTPDGHCTYTPDGGFVGDDSFHFTATDGLAFMVFGAATSAADVLAGAGPVATVHLSVVAPSDGGTTTTNTATTVPSTPTTVPIGSLPVTGNRTSLPLGVAVLAVLAGLGLVTVARRRSRPSNP